MRRRATGRDLEGLRYIGDMAVQLANMAREEGHRDLAALLEMAALEAKGGPANSNNGKFA